MHILRAITTRNVGTIDRIVRALPLVVVGALWYASVISGWPAIALAVLSVMLLLTSLTGSCSVYYMLGFSTCPVTNQTPPKKPQ